VPAALAAALFAGAAAANPQGSVVQAGAATIASSGSRVDIVQSSQRAVIDWRSFSIGAGGHVNFRHPSAAGATLNRVTGPEASAILGRLTANGTVFLVNPNGILIGPGAKIDVGGLVAATANITNENFMAGRYKFDEVVNRNAVIVNRGEITAHAGGLVALVAPGVENSGVIRAELGRVVLASGNRFTLDPFGDKLIAFAIDDRVAARLTDVDGRPLSAYVNQAGKIEAPGGGILLAASAVRSVLDNVINTSGVVRATSFAQRGGEIVLLGGDEGVVRVAGALDASGVTQNARGGVVDVRGETIAVGAGAVLDTSGNAGGGSITVFADGETRYAGHATARAPAVGDGGFVEISGQRSLAFEGTVDVGAVAGRGGTLLLDPADLVVTSSLAGALSSVLRQGGNAISQADGSITVARPIDGRGGSAGGTLLLDAGNGILVDSDIVTNGAAVTLRGGAGGITMTRGRPDSATNGTGTVIYAGSADIVLDARADIRAEHLVTTGHIGLRSGAGNVTLNQSLGGTLGLGVASATIRAGRDVALQEIRSAGPIDVRSDGGAITVAGGLSAGGAVTLGDPARVAATTIRLWNDVFTTAGDVDLNGTTLVNPLPGPDGIRYQPRLLFSNPDRSLFETPLVQVAVQTAGAGNIRFRGDVLYDTAPPNNSIQYVYNVAVPNASPFATFERTNPAHVAWLRGLEPTRPTGYYGLYVEVGDGTVSFARHVGTPDGTHVLAPVSSLGTANPAKSLWVKVESQRPAIGPGAGLVDWITFDPQAKVVVSQFQVRETPVTASFFAARPAGPFTLLTGLNLPRVRTVPAGDGPTSIPPAPRDVPQGTGFLRLAEIRPLPVVGDAARLRHAGTTLRDTWPAGTAASTGGVEAARGASRAADLGRGGGAHGAAADVFASERGPVESAGDLPLHVDRDYFGRAVFDYLDATAAPAGR
jgi:filamentous hemagglutinin family protein